MIDVQNVAGIAILALIDLDEPPLEKGLPPVIVQEVAVIPAIIGFVSRHVFPWSGGEDDFDHPVRTTLVDESKHPVEPPPGWFRRQRLSNDNATGVDFTCPIIVSQCVRRVC